jgi:hypothetical protein
MQFSWTDLLFLEKIFLFLADQFFHDSIWEILSAMNPGPILLLFQVNFLLAGLTLNRSRLGLLLVLCRVSYIYASFSLCCPVSVEVTCQDMIFGGDGFL